MPVRVSNLRSERNAAEERSLVSLQLTPFHLAINRDV